MPQRQRIPSVCRSLERSMWPRSGFPPDRSGRGHLRSSPASRGKRRSGQYRARAMKAWPVATRCGPATRARSRPIFRPGTRATSTPRCWTRWTIPSRRSRSDDVESRLVFGDGVLVAVLVRLSKDHRADAGKWFLDPGFGDASINRTRRSSSIWMRPRPGSRIAARSRSATPSAPSVHENLRPRFAFVPEWYSCNRRDVGRLEVRGPRAERRPIGSRNSVDASSGTMTIEAVRLEFESEDLRISSTIRVQHLNYCRFRNSDFEIESETLSGMSRAVRS